MTHLRSAHGGSRGPSAARRWRARLHAALQGLLRLTDHGTWVCDGVLGCAYPRTERALAALSHRGVGVLVNLHPAAHDPSRLARHGLQEVHLPVADFSAPALDVIATGIAAIHAARATGVAAAVHCGSGLGRTGTLLACYLVDMEDIDATEAIARIRALRPGSIETRAQAATVDAWARTA